MWLSAFAEEFDGLIDADAFRLVEVPKGANIVSGRWVNSRKTDGDGQVLKAKSRMVARGFSQSYGDDFLRLPLRPLHQQQPRSPCGSLLN